MIKRHLLTPFPTIILNDLIILRELIDSDAQAYLTYMNKPEMAEFITDNNMPSSENQALEEVRYWANLYKSHRSFYWGIALRENNQLIGTAGFNVISKSHLKAEISYDLNPDFWRKGIMLQSINNILKFGDYIGLARVQATVINTNQRSINLLERCDFLREGLLKKYEIVQGEHKDYYIYARIK